MAICCHSLGASSEIAVIRGEGSQTSVEPPRVMEIANSAPMSREVHHSCRAYAVLKPWLSREDRTSHDKSSQRRCESRFLVAIASVAGRVGRYGVAVLQIKRSPEAFSGQSPILSALECHAASV